MSKCRKTSSPPREVWDQWERDAKQHADGHYSQYRSSNIKTIKRKYKIRRRLAWEQWCPCDDCMAERVLKKLEGAE